jgi:hypothetical protein
MDCRLLGNFSRNIAEAYHVWDEVAARVGTISGKGDHVRFSENQPEALCYEESEGVGVGVDGIADRMVGLPGKIPTQVSLCGHDMWHRRVLRPLD